MPVARLPRHACEEAGRTSDGMVCYYGKKDTEDPTSRDLMYWVTLGLPRVDGENYARLESLGYVEPEYDGELLSITEITQLRDSAVVRFLSSVHSTRMKDAGDINNNTRK